VPETSWQTGGAVRSDGRPEHAAGTRYRTRDGGGSPIPGVWSGAYACPCVVLAVWRAAIEAVECYELRG